jgi:hypothetical protein
MPSLLISTELMDLLQAQLGDSIELVTLATQCQLDQVRGIVVSAGCVRDFLFDRPRHRLQIWPRYQVQTLARA